MAGQVLTIFERGEIDFGSPTQSAPVIGDVPLTQDIDISRYREIVMLIRVHNAAGIASAGAKISLKLKSVLPAADDPGQFFRDTANLLAQQDVGNGDAIGKLYRVTVASNAGAMASLFASGLQSGAGGGTLKAIVSVVLSLKE